MNGFVVESQNRKHLLGQTDRLISLLQASDIPHLVLFFPQAVYILPTSRQPIRLHPGHLNFLDAAGVFYIEDEGWIGDITDDDVASDLAPVLYLGRLRQTGRGNGYGEDAL